MSYLYCVTKDLIVTAKDNTLRDHTFLKAAPILGWPGCTHRIYRTQTLVTINIKLLLSKI